MFWRFGGSRRHRYDEDASAAREIADLNSPAVRRHRPLDDPETKPQAGAIRVELNERAEHRLRLAVGQTAALILHPDQDLVAFAARADRNPLPWLRELQPVLDRTRSMQAALGRPGVISSRPYRIA